MTQTDLGKWMITNGGEYDPSVTYEQLTMVKYGNSTYITLKTVTGVTPDNDKINYQLMAQGFDATALSAVTAQDQQGLLGDKGSEVSAQSLIDALADKVMNTVIAKLGTGNLPSGMTDVISGLATLNSNLQDYFLIRRVAGSEVKDLPSDSMADSAFSILNVAGYQPIFWILITTGSSQCFSPYSGKYIENDRTFNIRIFNAGSSSVETLVPYVDIFYIKGTD